MESVELRQIGKGIDVSTRFASMSFLAERDTLRLAMAIANPSVVCLSVVCNVRAPTAPTCGIETFGNIVSSFGTLAIL